MYFAWLLSTGIEINAISIPVNNKSGLFSNTCLLNSPDL